MIKQICILKRKSLANGVTWDSMFLLGGTSGVHGLFGPFTFESVMIPLGEGTIGELHSRGLYFEIGLSLAR